MADHQPYERPTDAFRSILPENGPSTSQLLAVVTLVPISAFLLFLAGITLTGTVIALAVSAPLWVIFSPILIPAALVVFLSVAGFLTSGAFGVTALSSLSWMANNLRGSRVPGQLEQAKRLVREAAEKAKEAGETIRSKALDGEMSEEGARAQTQEGGKGEKVGRAQEGGRIEQSERAQEVERAQEKSSSKEQGGKVQEGVKAQGGGKAQKGGKGPGGGKAQESGKT